MDLDRDIPGEESGLACRYSAYRSHPDTLGLSSGILLPGSRGDVKGDALGAFGVGPCPVLICSQALNTLFALCSLVLMSSALRPFLGPNGLEGYLPAAVGGGGWLDLEADVYGDFGGGGKCVVGVRGGTLGRIDAV